MHLSKREEWVFPSPADHGLTTWSPLALVGFEELTFAQRVPAGHMLAVGSMVTKVTWFLPVQAQLLA